MTDGPESVSVRITYAERETLTLGELQDLLDDLVDLLVASGGASQTWDSMRINYMHKFLYAMRSTVRSEVHLLRVHYNPVIEIIVLTGLAGAAALTRAWKQYSRARGESASADMKDAQADKERVDADVARARAETTIELERLKRDVILSLQTQLMDRAQTKFIDQDQEVLDLYERAANVIVSIEKIEALDQRRQVIDL